MAEWLVRETHDLSVEGSNPRRSRICTNSRLISNFSSALYRELLVVFWLVFAKRSFASVQ